MRMLIGLLLACCALSIGTGHTAGVLRLSHSEITLGGPERSGRLEAENIGDSPLYLDVTQQKVQTPLTVPEVRIPVGEVPSPSLLVSPMRMVLGPGQKQVLDLRVLRQPQRRQIWRITFRPRENFTAEARNDEGTIVPLSVSIGYGVVIYQQGTQQ